MKKQACVKPKWELAQQTDGSAVWQAVAATVIPYAELRAISRRTGLGRPWGTPPMLNVAFGAIRVYKVQHAGWDRTGVTPLPPSLEIKLP